MYAVAARLDPDRYLTLARAAYAEMALSGVSSVGEFHYLHHPAGGGRYADPNAMSEALIQAAADAGVRLTLLDTCYLAGGLDAGGHSELDAVQMRFADVDADDWAARVSFLPERPGLRIGAAVHSVRAVPAEQLGDVCAAARRRPLHVHVSEQPAENDACLAFYGRTPVALLRDRGVLGPDTTAVHATHLTGDDVSALGSTGTSVCACPSTEADLADGIGPFRRLRDAGSPLCLGSDQHALTDLLAETRLLEGDQRLTSGERGCFRPGELVDALTVDGHRALGWPDAGRIAPGQRADLLAVRLDSPRTAGSDPCQVVMTAGAADVQAVITDGRVVVADGQHVLGDVGRLLATAIEPLWEAR
jgi:formiminoglutamate deiminase